MKTVTIRVLAVTLVVATLSTLAQTNTPGLVSLWTGEGDASDTVGTNHALLNGDATFATGKVGQAFSFDGQTAYLEVPDSPSLDLRSNATLMAWIFLDQMPSDAGHTMSIMGKSQAGNDLDLQVEPDNRVRFYVGAGLRVGSVTVLQPGIWYHVAATYQADSQIELFINATREASAPIGISRAPNANSVVIGWNNVFPGRFYRGRIDQIRVFDAVTPSDTINDIYFAESGEVRAHIYTAVEICWSSVTNAAYQVQWSSSASSTDWTNLGTALPGTGTTPGVFDSTRNQPRKFYRIQLLP